MLTVAVSVSAGAEAIASAIPALYHHRVLISVIIVLLLMLMNLRGLRESAGLLMVPVYSFIAVITILIIVGLVKIVTGTAPMHATAQVGAVVPGITMALLLRAFSSGSSSLTGVEAISNAVPFFKTAGKECCRNISNDGLDFRILLYGNYFLNYWFGIVPTAEVTVLSQVGKPSLVKVSCIIYCNLLQH